MHPTVAAMLEANKVTVKTNEDFQSCLKQAIKEAKRVIKMKDYNFIYRFHTCKYKQETFKYN